MATFFGITCGLSAPYVAGQVHYAMSQLTVTTCLIGFNPVSLARDAPIENWPLRCRAVFQALEALEAAYTQPTRILTQPIPAQQAPTQQAPTLAQHTSTQGASAQCIPTPHPLPQHAAARHVIPIVGPEAITGSSRMKVQVLTVLLCCSLSTRKSNRDFSFLSYIDVNSQCNEFPSLPITTATLFPSSSPREGFRYQYQCMLCCHSY